MFFFIFILESVLIQALSTKSLIPMRIETLMQVHVMKPRRSKVLWSKQMANCWSGSQQLTFIKQIHTHVNLTKSGLCCDTQCYTSGRWFILLTPCWDHLLKPSSDTRGRCRPGFVQCNFSGEMKKAECAQHVNMILREEQKGQETGGLQLDILHNRLPGSNLLWDGCQLKNVTQILSPNKVLVW